jgi:hypothetical protein
MDIKCKFQFFIHLFSELTQTFNVKSFVLTLKKSGKRGTYKLKFLRIPIDLQILPRILSALIIKEPN